MTLVIPQVVVEVWDGQTRQLPYHEIAGLMNEMERMFGEVVYSPQTVQQYLDRYCQRKDRKPLLVVDMSI